VRIWLKLDRFQWNLHRDSHKWPNTMKWVTWANLSKLSYLHEEIELLISCFNLPLTWSESIEIWQSCDGKHIMTPAHCDKSPLKEITLRAKEKQLLQGRRYARALDRGRIGVFKTPMTHWRWCRGRRIRFYNKTNKKIFFLYENHPLIRFIHLMMQEYDSKMP
jgi:hypothetical protein